MRPPGDSHTLTLNSSRTEEARMRASLGMAADDQAGRSDSGQGGRPSSPSPSVRRAYEPPDASRARLAALTRELKAEREERVAAQQALANAQQVIQRLQAQLAHTEMAAAEALQAEQQARLSAEARLRAPSPATPEVGSAAAVPKKRGRPPGKRLVSDASAEPQPVKWWLTSYKTAKAKPTRSKSRSGKP